MVNFNRINDALNTPEVADEVTLSVVSLAGTRTLNIEAGSTVAQVKEDNEMENVKFVTEEGVILGNNDVISEDMTIYISASKENGSVLAPVSKKK